MEFNPNNHIVQLCIKGMSLEESGNVELAATLFMQAWNEATTDLEKFIAAHYVARTQEHPDDKLKWLKTALTLALEINDDTVNSALPALYLNMCKCYQLLNDEHKANENYQLAEMAKHNPTDSGPFYHGTKADLQVGDLLTAGGNSNYKADLKMNHIYFTALLNGAGLAAALANGDGAERVYIIEPTGTFENDPNVTDKKFPGNPTRSYRSLAPLKIIGESTDWQRITSDELKKWRERLANNKGDIIN